MAGESVFSVHTGRRCGRLDNNSAREKVQAITKVTRWYPWGIQKLVSTYVQGQHRIFGGGGGVFYRSQNSKTSKLHDLPKFECSGWGGGYSMEVKTQKLL